MTNIPEILQDGLENIGKGVKWAGLSLLISGGLGVDSLHRSLSHQYGESFASAAIFGTPALMMLATGAGAWFKQEEIKRMLLDYLQPESEQQAQVIEHAAEVLSRQPTTNTRLPVREQTTTSAPLPLVDSTEYATLVRSLAYNEGHMLFIGSTGGGKTTIMHDMAVRLSKMACVDVVVVLDPDAVEGHWPNCHVFGRGNDWDSIRTGLKLISDEVEKRFELRKDGVTRFNRTIIVWDEGADIIKGTASSPDDPPGTKSGKDVMEELLRRSRKVGINFMLGTTDANAKTLGIEGQAAMKDNFAVVVRATRVEVTDGVQRYLTIQYKDREAIRILTPTLKTQEEYQSRIGEYSVIDFRQKLQRSTPIYTDIQDDEEDMDDTRVHSNQYTGVQSSTPIRTPQSVQSVHRKSVHPSTLEIAKQRWPDIQRAARGLIAKYPEPTRFPYGNGKLTKGQVMAIKSLWALSEQLGMGLTITNVCEELFNGNRGGHQSRAVKNVLGIP